MVIHNISKQIEQGVRISKIVARWRLVIAITSFLLMYLSYLLGDKESKRKQKSPGTAAASGCHERTQVGSSSMYY